MQPSNRPSCLSRLITFAITISISILTGALVMLVITLLYPKVNPALGSLLETNQVPRSADLLWIFWVVVPGLISMAFALISSLLINLIQARRSRAAQAGSR